MLKFYHSLEVQVEHKYIFEIKIIEETKQDKKFVIL